MYHADGVIELNGVTLLELEDVAKRYRHPSIIDIKLGFRTWYPSADQRYIDKCKVKDASTTQAALGFKICGMQVSHKRCSLCCCAKSLISYWHCTTPTAVWASESSFSDASLLILWGRSMTCMHQWLCCPCYCHGCSPSRHPDN